LGDETSARCVAKKLTAHWASSPTLQAGAFDQIAAGITHLTPTRFGDGRPHRPANLQRPLMEIGIDSLADILPDPATGRFPSATDRIG
jgi:hypothetical protein